MNDDLIRAIDDCLIAITDRLKEKSPMYIPDSEWNALAKAQSALSDAKNEVKRKLP